jgi:RNA polymerase sigma-70 factor (ECF subfamily)
MTGPGATTLESTTSQDAPAVPDRALMRRVADGDDAAFTLLVDRYGPRLFVVARRLLGSPADAEDAVQRTLLRCLTGARSYRPAWAVSTWLYRILTNVCIDQMRRHGTAEAWRRRAARDATGIDGQTDGAGGRRPPGAGRAGAADRIHRRLDLDRALARVPPEARLLLALRYADGLSYSELARARGISVNTVKSQLARGKSILRAALEGD